MKFYRYELRDFSYEIINIRLVLIEFDCYRETPKGYWIWRPALYSKKVWIRKKSKKRYAYPTKEEALSNLVARTKRRISILEYQMKLSKLGLELAELRQSETLSNIQQYTD